MFVNKLIAALCAGFVLCACTAVSLAEEPVSELDRIEMNNGSVLFGTVTGARDGEVTLDTEFAGSLTLKLSDISSISTQSAMVVQLEDGTVLPERPLDVKDGVVVLAPDTQVERSYVAGDIRVVNPEPWELGLGYNRTGALSFMWKLERGNTDNDELDYALESIWRSLEDRYTFRLNGENDETNNQKSADNWRMIGKYDRFIEGPWYWGANIGAEQDEFAELDLRYYMGPYMGRHFYDTPALTLDGELGLAYVHEQYFNSPTQEYIGANWNVHFQSDILSDASRVYVNHVGIWNLDTPSDIILNTTFGLAVPLWGSLEGAAEVLIEYDSGAVEGVENLDQTYNLRIGYTW